MSAGEARAASVPAGSPGGAARRWHALIRERFPPAAYVPMAALFVLGNGAYAVAVHGAAPAWWRFGVALVLALSFFFRLRLFDEIKDHEVDLAVHPERPLARGLLSPVELKRVIYGLTGLELLLAAALGWALVLAHALAVAYSYLMYNEFFIGRWLRPRLTTYAVTHTFVSALLGLSVAAVASGRGLGALGWRVLAFGAVNWALFNVFEFARKTFAPAEERPGVESYSKIFGPAGAALLTASQLAVALAVLAVLGVPGRGAAALGWQLGLLAVVVLPALAYALRPVPPAARVFRAAASAYLVLFFAVLSVQLLA
ncbi:MAG: hypothetical protein KatS3mg102_1831 [Planctomycetota bacterium]|nr:MAG: hypothetical protein KatS3mg102_1831 [Planctomycetota bacterium]